MDLVNQFVSDSKEWSKGRFPWFRLVILIIFIYVWIRHLNDPMYQDLFKGLNLGVHELGHFIFGIFGEFIGIAGGSIAQCLLPVISLLMFYRQRDFFAISVSFGWLATNFFDVAIYIADSRARELPLVSPFGGCEDIVHDWEWLLTYMGILRYDLVIASIVRLSASLCMVVCIVWALWTLYFMFRYNEAKKDGLSESFRI